MAAASQIWPCRGLVSAFALLLRFSSSAATDLDLQPGWWTGDDACQSPSNDAEARCELSLRQLRARPVHALAGQSTSSPSSSSPSVMHVIGDTHANNNYLVRCLLSTGRFALQSGQISWRPDLSEGETWQVVVAGDQINKGDRSLTNLLLLKRLSEDARWGSRLVVLKGNHESGVLLLQSKYVKNKRAPHDNWSPAGKLRDLTAMSGDGFELVEWMVNRPVLHFAQGMLAMHGGMSLNMAVALTQEESVKQACNAQGVACGRAMAARANSIAQEYYARVHDCMEGLSNETEAKLCTRGLPYVLAGENKTCGAAIGKEGLLNYRGYSENNCLWDAGGTASCKEAEQVGTMLGAEVFVVAHTTHRWIRDLCQATGTRVFNVDTHWGVPHPPRHCGTVTPPECDFAPEHLFRGEASAQSLLVELHANGSRTMRNCTALVSSYDDAAVHCTSLP